MGTGHTHAGHTHHAHGPHGEGQQRALLLALILTTLFLAVEVIGGLLTGSLALLSDAAHMFTDTAALAIALAAIRIGRRRADHKRTFGYYRYEILAAAFNAILLFAAALYILVEAWQRLRHPPAIQSTGMLAIAVLGLAVNLLGMRILSGGKDASMNVKGAYLEVWSDMLGSIGVIAGALLIRWTGWSWIDSLVAVGIGAWVLPRTWTLLRESLNVLLEGVPQDLAIADVEAALRGVPGVAGLHDLHVWAISSGKTSLTVHVVAPDGADGYPRLLREIRHMLAHRFGIHHSTVQLEPEPCEQARDVHSFAGAHAEARDAAGHAHRH